MNSDLECPYCEQELDVCHDDGFGYTEGDKHEMQCYHCNKYFVFETTISFHYEPSKADCLNDKEHNLVKIKDQFYPERAKCKDCDYEHRGPFDQAAHDKFISNAKSKEGGG